MFACSNLSTDASCTTLKSLASPKHVCGTAHRLSAAFSISGATATMTSFTFPSPSSDSGVFGISCYLTSALLQSHPCSPLPRSMCTGPATRPPPARATLSDPIGLTISFRRARATGGTSTTKSSTYCSPWCATWAARTTVATSTCTSTVRAWSAPSLAAGPPALIR